MYDNHLNPKQNHILKSLPLDVYERITPHLHLIEMPLGEVLHETRDTLDYVYFPVNCIISLLCTMKNGSSSEIAIIGFEGLVGVSLFLGGKSMAYRTVVQSGGYAYRIKQYIFMQEFARHNELLIKTLNYTHALIAQMIQTAACNRHHTVDQQLCRWLLSRLDRLSFDILITTHEMIANKLGVRREAVSEAAGKLQEAGLIRYARGHITALDRSGLEARVCECYQSVKKETHRILYS